MGVISECDDVAGDDERGKRGEIGEALYILLRLFTNECECE